MTERVFTVPGRVRGKRRHRMGRGHAYKDQETVAYESWVRLCYQQAYPGQTPLEGPLGCVIHAYYKVPKSWPKKKQAKALSGEIRPGKPDADNIAKALTDPLNNLAYSDDYFIADLRVIKLYCAEEPFVVVRLWELH